MPLIADHTELVQWTEPLQSILHALWETQIHVIVYQWCFLPFLIGYTNLFPFIIHIYCSDIQLPIYLFIYLHVWLLDVLELETHYPATDLSVYLSIRQTIRRTWARNPLSSSGTSLSSCMWEIKNVFTITCTRLPCMFISWVNEERHYYSKLVQYIRIVGTHHKKIFSQVMNSHRFQIVPCDIHTERHAKC